MLVSGYAALEVVAQDFVYPDHALRLARPGMKPGPISDRWKMTRRHPDSIPKIISSSCADSNNQDTENPHSNTLRTITVS